MNATNLENGFAVEEQKKPGTSGSMGVKPSAKPKEYQKASKWAGAAGKSTLGKAGNSILTSSIDSSKNPNGNHNNSSQNILRIAEEGEDEGDDNRKK